MYPPFILSLLKKQDNGKGKKGKGKADAKLN